MTLAVLDDGIPIKVVSTLAIGRPVGSLMPFGREELEVLEPNAGWGFADVVEMADLDAWERAILLFPDPAMRVDLPAVDFEDTISLGLSGRPEEAVALLDDVCLEARERV